MSAFEFVLVSFAIMIGFAVSEVLAGWGEQIRARDRLRPHALQIASSAFILYFSLQYLWGLWLLRGVDWTFPFFLLVAAPALALALASHITRVDTSSDVSLREQYFRNSRPVYSLLASFPIVLIAISLVPDLRESVPSPIDFVAITIVRLAVFASFVSLAWSRSERFHWVVLLTIWLISIAFMVRLLTYSLVGAAA